MITQEQMVKKHLEDGYSITPLEALRMFGSLRLGAIIHNLRKDGMDIKTDLVQNGSKHYAKYSLIKPALKFEGSQMVLA